MHFIHVISNSPWHTSSSVHIILAKEKNWEHQIIVKLWYIWIKYDWFFSETEYNIFSATICALLQHQIKCQGKSNLTTTLPISLLFWTAKHLSCIIVFDLFIECSESGSPEQGAHVLSSKLVVRFSLPKPLLYLKSGVRLIFGFQDNIFCGQVVNAYVFFRFMTRRTCLLVSCFLLSRSCQRGGESSIW